MCRERFLACAAYFDQNADNAGAMAADVRQTSAEIHAALDNNATPDDATLSRVHWLVEGCKDRLMAQLQGKISHVNGDIAAQSDVDAVVNAANGDLAAGGGVSGALHAAAGSSMTAEASGWIAKNGPLETGKVAVTGAGNLRRGNIGPKSVLHAATVEHLGGSTSAETVRRAMRNVVMSAKDSGAKKIAVPILGAGTGGLSANDAEAAMMKGIRDKILDIPDLQEIRLVHYGQAALAA